MKLSYCAQQLYETDRDRFFQSLFIPEDKRHFLQVIGALNAELIRIHNNVTEEMIGHIRYAWWQEKIEALFEGKLTAGHPVLEALMPMAENKQLPMPAVTALIETYRSHYPAVPHDVHERMDSLEKLLISKHCPGTLARWEKAGDIILRHRNKHPVGHNGTLALKLLFLR